MGPFSYLVAASDLKTTSEDFRIFKYADDTYLVTAGKNHSRISYEIDHVSQWAQRNNLKLNNDKTKEIVIYKKGKKKENLSPQTSGINRVMSINVLGVTIQNNLSMEEHVNEILGTCSNSLYALSVLKAHGLSAEALQEVFRSKILNRLLYASQAWWGFASASTVNRIDAYLKKCKKYGYCPASLHPFVNQCAHLDAKLFAQVQQNSEHVLYPLLPATKDHKHNLRNRKHKFVLPPKDDKNFICRVLYTTIY